MSTATLPELRLSILKQAGAAGDGVDRINQGRCVPASAPISAMASSAGAGTSPNASRWRVGSATYRPV